MENDENKIDSSKQEPVDFTLHPETQEVKDKETLDKAEALLKTAKTAEDYQQLAKLYAEVEKAYADPEKLKGRDPEKFLKEVFDWMGKDDYDPTNEYKNWGWEYHKINGVVDMHYSTEDLPKEFIDKEDEIYFADDEKDVVHGSGIDILTERLKGKRVISCKGGDDGWFLQVVEGEAETEASMETAEQIKSWQEFYKEQFGRNADLSNLEIPEKQEGFDRLIVVLKGMTAELLISKCKEQFKCSIDNVTKALIKNGISFPRQKPNNPLWEDYAIWTRNRTEADDENAGLSADIIDAEQVLTMTLQERLLLELKYFKETGEHLDMQSRTLCSGSRFSDSSIPLVEWLNPPFDELIISSGNWTQISYDENRARTIIAE